MTTRIPETRCLECGARISAISDLGNATRGPRPGEPVACIRCGAVATVDASGKLCGFTQQQMDELTADTEIMDELAKAVANIHLVNLVPN